MGRDEDGCADTDDLLLEALRDQLRGSERHTSVAGAGDHDGVPLLLRDGDHPEDHEQHSVR